ncbi:MAG TPA: sigma-70 family RNA polymerase sigma factor [Candidatus Angelobacter sp.]|nr:sigma-70 family RNA polymerase sigma factor [Candidatus Angelobacter sp.]
MSTTTKLGPLEQNSWDDDRLVQCCLKGDEDAWGVLIDRYKNLIFSIPIKYGFSPEDAADVFQSVCLDFLRELPRLRDVKALPKWLTQVSAHTCLRRRKQQQPADSVDDMETIADIGQMMPEDRLHEINQEQALRNAVANLSPRCQNLVRMLFYESPSRPYTEIASRLGLAVGSIGFIRGRCLGKLRQALDVAGFQ